MTRTEQRLLDRMSTYAIKYGLNITRQRAAYVKCSHQSCGAHMQWLVRGCTGLEETVCDAHAVDAARRVVTRRREMYPAANFPSWSER